MGAEQTAAKAAADEAAAAEAKAAAEQEAKAAAEQEAKAAEEKAAAEKAAAEAKAAKAEPKARGAAASKGYTVTGAAVVLRTKDKSERYLYRGAVIPDGVYAEDSIKHALSVGLIEKTK
jgi:hypothetical protein